MYLLPLRIHVYSTGREGDSPERSQREPGHSPWGQLCSSGLTGQVYHVKEESSLLFLLLESADALHGPD